MLKSGNGYSARAKGGLPRDSASEDSLGEGDSEINSLLSEFLSSAFCIMMTWEGIFVLCGSLMRQ